MHEKEIRLYWRVASDLRKSIREGQEQKEIELQTDELEAVFVHTDYSQLKKRAVELLTKTRPKLATGGSAIAFFSQL